MDAATKEAEEKKLKEQEAAVGLVCIIALVFTLIALCYMCCICCCQTSLKRAIDVIDASADFMRSTKRLLLVPLIFFAMNMMFFPVWLTSIAHVASWNEIKADILIPQGKDVIWTDEKTYMAWYLVFGGFWVMAWIDATSQFVVMYSAATYYFNSSADTEGGAEVCGAFSTAYLNHMGSLAFGAFLIAIVKTL